MSGLLSVLTMACAAAPGDSPPSLPGAGSNHAVRSLSLDDAVRAARADAARRTGLGTDALVLISAETVTWSDGSLGCPKPGMAYTQALVPGYRIRLRGPAGELDYHAGTRGAVFLCPAKLKREPVRGPSGAV